MRLFIKQRRDFIAALLVGQRHYNHLQGPKVTHAQINL